MTPWCLQGKYIKFNISLKYINKEIKKYKNYFLKYIDIQIPMHFLLKCTFIFFFISFSLFWYFYFYRFCKMGNNLGISHLSIGLWLFINRYCILYMWKCHHPMLCYRTQIRCLIIVMTSMLMDNNIYYCFNTNM
jgi:hypothetical protein